MKFKSMETAPKDRPILVLHNHDADTYYDPWNPMSLTTYAAHCEGLSSRPGITVCSAVWGGSYSEDVSGEGWGPHIYIPDWWFEESSDFEIPLNPIGWMDRPPLEVD